MMLTRRGLFCAVPRSVVGVARLHTTHVPKAATAAAAAPSAAASESASTTAAGEKKSKLHGSLHWNAERALSIGFLALVPAAVLVPSAPVDFALGVVFPLHAYLGIQSLVIDYLPKRKTPAGFFLGMTTLRLVTLLSFYGLYELNANDIGITAAVKKLWQIR